MTRVLLVEDDRGISEPLARALRREGYEVDVRADGHAALEAARENPDLVVLDLGLPLLDGLEVCRRLRQEGRTVPVMILTARADELDAVVGLDAGADDYVVKPFRFGELSARIRALLRRHGVEGLAPPEEDELRLDVHGRQAWFQGEQLRLTAKEFDLLRVLVRERGRVVARDQLMREVWGTDWYHSSKTLDMHISSLRKKIGDDATQPRFIATVRGLGFRFQTPTTQESRPEAPE
ncbi:MAG TPA: response regulator transcription factor [Dermatophilaceae bacterium]|nr:response regulator transcription factor [Dermatophilaceae bacterium]